MLHFYIKYFSYCVYTINSIQQTVFTTQEFRAIMTQKNKYNFFAPKIISYLFTSSAILCSV